MGVSDVLNVDQNSRSRLIIIISIPRLTKKSTVANMSPKLDPENLTGIPLGSKLPLMRQSHPCMSMNRSGNGFKDRMFKILASYNDIVLGSVAGPVIKANGRLTFEDDLRSEGLLYFTTQ